MYYLGIDAGGTSTKARLTNQQGEVIGESKAGPGNMRLGTQAVANEIIKASLAAMDMAKLTKDDVHQMSVGMGIAGLGRPGAEEELRAQFQHFQNLNLTHDADIARLGAHAGKDGGIIIIGTGSIGIGKVGDENIRVGGYGFPISDEGSGAYIGLQAIRITLRASDGRLEHSDLTRKTLARFNGETQEIVRWMDSATATEYATMAPDVVDAAEQGDYHGRLITNHSAWHLEIMIRGLYGHKVPRVSLLGGLAHRIEPWLSPDIRLKLNKPEGDALDGALWLARQA